MSPDPAGVVESLKEIYQQTRQGLTFRDGAIQRYELKERSLIRMVVLNMSKNWPLAAPILLYLLSVEDRTHSSLRFTLKRRSITIISPPLDKNTN